MHVFEPPVIHLAGWLDEVCEKRRVFSIRCCLRFVRTYDLPELLVALYTKLPVQIMESTSTTTMISATSTAADDYSNIVDAPKTPPPVTIASDVIANPADAELCMTSMAASRIALGKRLLATLELFRAVEGVQKIERKIGQEVKFLERVVKSGQLKVNHVLCSNLVHYESLTETLLRCANIKHIDYPVAMVERQSPLRVDIVADNGSTWIKGM